MTDEIKPDLAGQRTHGFQCFCQLVQLPKELCVSAINQWNLRIQNCLQLQQISVELTGLRAEPQGQSAAVENIKTLANILNIFGATRERVINGVL